MRFKKIKVIAFIVALYSFLGFVTLPYLVQSNFSKLLKENLNTKAYLGKVYLNPYTFELKLDNLLVHDDKNNTLVYFKSFYIDLNFTSLFKGEIVINYIKIDSLKTNISLYKNKKFNFSHIVEFLEKNKSSKTNSENKEDKESSSSFVLKLKNFVAKDTRIVYSDETKENLFEVKSLPFEVTLKNFTTTSEKQAYFKTFIQLEDLLNIDFESDVLLSPLSFDGNLAFQNIKLKKLNDYLQDDLKFDFGGFIKNISTNFDIKVDEKIIASFDDINLNIDSANYKDDKYKASLKAFDTKIPKTNIIKDEKLQVKLAGGIQIKSVDLVSLKNQSNKFHIKGESKNISSDFSVKLKENLLDANITDTKLSFPLFKYSDKKFDTKIKDTNTTIKSVVLSKDTNISYLISNVSLDNKIIEFIDKNKYKNKILSFKNLDIKVDDFSSDKSDTSNITLNINTPKKGDITLNSSLKLEPLFVKNSLKIDSLDLSAYKHYVKEFVNLDIKSSFIKSDLSIDITNETQKINGDLELLKVDIFHSVKNKRLLSVDDLLLSDIKYKNNDLSINNILIDKLYTTVKIDENKKTNLDNLFVEKNNTKNKINKENKKSDAEFHYYVKNIKLKNGKLDFSDHSLPLKFDTDIHSLNAHVKDLSSKDKEANINLTGVVKKYGSANIEIKTKPSDFKDKTQAFVKFENIDVKSFTPYSGKFVGRKIEEGKLNLDLDYDISSSNLSSTNRIRLKDMRFGDEVNSSEAVNLPLELAIALLEDSTGLIDVSIPIKGDIDNPEFELGPVIWKAVGNMITNIVTAPFRFLGSLLGLDGDELGNVEFKFASKDILPPQKEKLDKLIGVLKDKKDLAILIVTSYDLQNDTKALTEQRFKDMVKGKNKEESIKKLYINIFGKEKLDKITKKYKKEEIQAVLSKNIKNSIKISNNDLQTLAKSRADNLKNYFISKGLNDTRVDISNKIEEIKQNSLEKVTVKLELNAKGN